MPEDLRARALRLLARREHSRRELERKLAAHCPDRAELARVLDALEARGWLSEQRVVEQVVQARRARFGARAIERELREKGVSEEAIAAVLPALRAGDFEAARAVWRRKFGHAPRTAAERARQARFLQGRGFPLDVIAKLIGGKEEP